MAENPLKKMTPGQLLRHWADIVEKGENDDDGYEVESVTESVDKTQITIIVKTKR